MTDPEMQDFDEDDPVWHSAAVRWRRGEEQLYLAALSGADVYRRSLDLVGRTAEHLRSLGPAPAALVEAAGRRASLVAEALAPASAEPAGVDLGLVADAALALRWRELLAERTRQRRLDRLRAARERGDAWVVLELSGDAEGDPLLPYRRLEAAVETGWAVLVTTIPDAGFASSLHAVEAVRVDLRTGAVSAPDDDRVAATMHRSVAARESRASALRGQLID